MNKKWTSNEQVMDKSRLLSHEQTLSKPICKSYTIPDQDMNKSGKSHEETNKSGTGHKQVLNKPWSVMNKSSTSHEQVETALSWAIHNQAKFKS